MKRITMTLLAISVVWVFISLCLPSISTAEYPEKPVTMICGFPPGEGLDLTSRTVAEMAKKHFPRPIAVVNRPGASGTIGTAEVIRSKPDGYTIGSTTVAALTVQPHRTKLPYGLPIDYTPLIKLVNNSILLAVKETSPWKTAKDFIAEAKSNPGKIRIAHSGLGTILHLNVEQLLQAAKVDFTLVPYAGSKEAVPALLGGHVDAVVSHPATIISQVKARNLRVIGVFEEARNKKFPDAPTFKELGYDITMGVYYGIIGPKGLDALIAEKLHMALKKSIEEPRFVKMVEESGLFVAYESPEVFKARLEREYRTNAKLIEIIKRSEKK